MGMASIPDAMFTHTRSRCHRGESFRRSRSNGQVSENILSRFYGTVRLRLHAWNSEGDNNFRQGIDFDHLRTVHASVHIRPIRSCHRLSTYRKGPGGPLDLGQHRLGAGGSDTRGDRYRNLAATRDRSRSGPQRHCRP